MRWSNYLLSSSLSIVPVAAWAADGGAFKIGGKVTTFEEAYKAERSEFFEIEIRKYELVERIAHQRYLDSFWQKKAAESKTSVEAARKSYLEKNASVSKKEIKETLEKFKDHPQLKKLSAAQQEEEVKGFLKERSSRKVESDIIEKAVKTGDLVILVPRPPEPVFEVELTDNDNTRFGPNPDDDKPAGCEKKSCPITIVEYSEFQCPFCEKVLPDVKRILAEYKGKISWTVRDYPLPFHDRARPAAVAAKCAAEQGKYWHMYTELFANQQSLGDDDLKKYAAKVVPDKAKWEACFAKPEAKQALIDNNLATGRRLGVSGTPAFFINGRKISGAQPYSEFKRIIDDEMTKGKKS